MMLTLHSGGQRASGSCLIPARNVSVAGIGWGCGPHVETEGSPGVFGRDYALPAARLTAGASTDFADGLTQNRWKCRVPTDTGREPASTKLRAIPTRLDILRAFDPTTCRCSRTKPKERHYTPSEATDMS